MHDSPPPAAILDAVATALRSETPPSSFERRVAAAALDIARRELEQDPQIAVFAEQRLTRILGGSTDTPAGGRAGELMETLADRIRDGELSEETPGLMDCLWSITMARVAVDQPTFALYVRLTEEDDPDEPEP